MEPFVLALATLGLADSISFMIVTPSLAFYISSLGGSQDFYGFVLAVFSFTAFCGKPILGRWSDAQNFHWPYMASISLSVLGGVFYAIAPAFSSTKAALASVALGRIVAGFGTANSALGFAYVARACPAEQRTSVTTILGGVQMIGMAIAPLFSACLVHVDFDLMGVHFDNLNSVGLLLVGFNLASQIVVYLYLPDLPVGEDSDESDDEDEKESEWLLMLRCILRNPHIGVPFLTIFTFNFNWQFIETALAPASFDSLGWGPVQVSYVLGVMACLVFLGMITVNKLSGFGVSDFKLLCGGLFGNSIGYVLLYLLWYRGVHYILFVIPVFVGAGSFPFLGAPNRSLFSAAVDNTPELADYHGTMQALLSMSSSVGGFTAPGMITHFCLRTPEEVSLSNDSREFWPVALFSPLLSLCVFAATFMGGEPGKSGVEKRTEELPNESVDEEKPDEEKPDEEKPDETTPLTGTENVPRRRSDGEEPPRKPHTDRPRRRRSLMESARSASIRGCMLTPMTLIPPDGTIYDDE